MISKGVNFLSFRVTDKALSNMTRLEGNERKDLLILNFSSTVSNKHRKEGSEQSCTTEKAFFSGSCNF